MKTAEEFLKEKYNLNPIPNELTFFHEKLFELMEEYASQNEVIEFLEKWISHFEAEGIQNHFCIEAREMIKKLNKLLGKFVCEHKKMRGPDGLYFCEKCGSPMSSSN